MKFEDNAFDGLDESIYKANVVDINDSGTSGLINVKEVPIILLWIASYFNSLARCLKSGRQQSFAERSVRKIYRCSLFPSIGVVLGGIQSNQLKRLPMFKLNIGNTSTCDEAAWYLRSFGGSDYRFYTANGNATEAHEFNNMANIFRSWSQVSIKS